MINLMHHGPLTSEDESAISGFGELLTEGNDEDKGGNRNDETTDQLIDDNSVDIEDVEFEMDSNRDDQLSNYIKSKSSYKRDISSILYSRVFELIPFIRSYLDLKPQMLL